MLICIYFVTFEMRCKNANQAIHRTWKACWQKFNIIFITIQYNGGKTTFGYPIIEAGIN